MSMRQVRLSNHQVRRYSTISDAVRDMMASLVFFAMTLAQCFEPMMLDAQASCPSSLVERNFSPCLSTHFSTTCITALNIFLLMSGLSISFLTVGATPQESLACAHAIPPEGILEKSLIYLFNRWNSPSFELPVDLFSSKVGLFSSKVGLYRPPVMRTTWCHNRR